MRRRIVCLAVPGLLLLLPLVSANPGVYGTIVDGNDADLVVWYDLTFSSAKIAYEDIGSTTGAPDATDAFFIDLNGNGIVNLNDIILTSQGGSVGTQVTASNTHLGNTLITTNLPTNLILTKDYAPSYADGGPDGAFSIGDGMFVDVDSSGDASTNDIVLTSPSATFGSRLSATSTDVTETIFDPLKEAVCDGTTKIAGGGTACTGARTVTNVYFEDTDTDDALDTGEDVYIATSTKVAGGHYRVRYAAASTAEPAFSPVLCGSSLKDTDCADTIEKLSTGAITSAVMSAGALANVKGHDADGSGDYTVGDGVYIDNDGDGFPSAGDVRLIAAGLTSGKQPLVTESDFVHALAAVPVTYQFIFSDVDVDTTLGSTENVVIDFDGDTRVDLGDLHITSHNSCVLGSQRSATNTCDQTSWTALAARIGWTDQNNNAVLDIGDSLYLDADGDGSIEVNDVRLTAYGSKTAGSRVTSSDSAELSATPTLLATTVLTYVDVDGGGSLSYGDHLYLDLDANGFVSPGDVRLSSGITGGAYGTFVDLDDADGVAVLTAVPGAGTLDAYDVSGDGVDSSDPVYVFTKTTPAGTLAAYDLRLTAGLGTSKAAGTFLGVSDSAVGATTAGSTIAFCYADLDLDSAFSPGDGLYAHFGACTGSVGPKDVRVSVPSFATGSRVVASDSDANNALSALPAGATVRFYDIDSDGGLGSGDRVYLNVDNTAELAVTGPGAALVSVSDVRLSGTGGVSSGTTGGGGATTTTTTTTAPTTTQTTTTATQTGTETVTQTTTQTATATQTTTTTVTQGPADTGTDTGTGTGTTRTPGFGLVAFVAALGVAGVLLRRRS